MVLTISAIFRVCYRSLDIVNGSPQTSINSLFQSILVVDRTFNDTNVSTMFQNNSASCNFEIILIKFNETSLTWTSSGLNWVTHLYVFKQISWSMFNQVSVCVMGLISGSKKPVSKSSLCAFRLRMLSESKDELFGPTRCRNSLWSSLTVRSLCFSNQNNSFLNSNSR